MRRIAAASWLVGAVLVSAAGCQPPPHPPSTHPAPAGRALELSRFLGTWRWMLRTTDAGTTRVEDEQWQFHPGSVPTQLLGRYIRSVEVRSDDRVPFHCNQRPWYRQRAVFDVVVEVTPEGFAIRETDYRAEPSPCDRGFRHAGTYTAALEGDRLRLRWGEGEQVLKQIDDGIIPLPDDPWPTAPPVDGRWRWDATSYDDAGNLQDETEWWELVRRSETQLDATYRRRVTVRSPDGSTIACAGAPSWSFDDAYVLDGRREEEHWHLHERAAAPGDHPCLEVTPRRALDEATVEQLGDDLIFEWRGKRRQVLYRPG